MMDKNWRYVGPGGDRVLEKLLQLDSRLRQAECGYVSGWQENDVTVVVIDAAKADAILIEEGYNET